MTPPEKVRVGCMTGLWNESAVTHTIPTGQVPGGPGQSARGQIKGPGPRSNQRDGPSQEGSAGKAHVRSRAPLEQPTSAAGQRSSGDASSSGSGRHADRGAPRTPFRSKPQQSRDPTLVVDIDNLPPSILHDPDVDTYEVDPRGRWLEERDEFFYREQRRGEGTDYVGGTPVSNGHQDP